ncbi:MAG TPA: glycosyltransferase family 87 protein, partial [Pirellulales bacterium]|nr:glycosyltransferase family 87 protein [Pirellulales bacterium]
MTWCKPTRARVLVVLALVFAIWGWADVRLRGAIDPTNAWNHKTDLTVFTEAGAAFFDGRDPYAVTNVRGWKYLYPPLFAILLAPLHHLPPQSQVLVWFALSVLMVWGCYRECVRIGRAISPSADARGTFGAIPSWIGYCGVVAALLPALNCLQRGQVSVANMYLLLLGFRLLLENRGVLRCFAAGVVLALPIAIKITPLLPVGFLLLQQLVAAWNAHERAAALARWKACAAGNVVGLVLCFLIVPAAWIGWRANLHHLGTWWTSVAVHADAVDTAYFAPDVSTVRNQSFTNAVLQLGNWTSYRLGWQTESEAIQEVFSGRLNLWTGVPIVSALVLAVRTFAGLLLLVVGYRMGRANEPVGQAAGFGLACVSILIVARVARAHYFVLLLPAVIFVGVWLLRAQRPKLAACFVLLPGLLTLVHY